MKNVTVLQKEEEAAPSEFDFDYRVRFNIENDFV
tara:strand:- start:1237 stop:1338 length:102 start_codon:yes stop_codon:yes gene_type:complete